MDEMKRYQVSEISEKWSSAKTDADRAAVLAQFRADLDARAAMAKPIMTAWRRGDLDACEQAQTAMRRRFRS
jgi:hypothetical protein